MASAGSVSNPAPGALSDSHTQHVGGRVPSGPVLMQLPPLPLHAKPPGGQTLTRAGPLQVLPGGYHLASADAGGTIAVKDLRMLGGALANSASPRGSSARWAPGVFWRQVSTGFWVRVVGWGCALLVRLGLQHQMELVS